MESILGFFKNLFKYRHKLVGRVMFYISMICALTVIIHVGYITNNTIAGYSEDIIVWMFYVLFLLQVLYSGSSIIAQRKINLSHISGLVILLYFLFITFAQVTLWGALVFFASDEWMYLGIALMFVSELSKNSLFFDNFYFNPTILFVISFIALIMLGTVLLMLPRTTLLEPLNFVDALFMATSAVCITGLAVTDISTNFSLFGQTVVLILIQIGGLGIMTFTGFFGYFFSGGFSYKNQLMFGEILDENKINSVISTLLKIIYITLLFEFIGCVLLFFALDPTHFESMGEQVFFAVFHAVSSFCNSGFSILPDGIHNPAYRFNYSFQLLLAAIFIFGGLGFATVYNFYNYGKLKINALWHAYVLKAPYRHQARTFSFNARFILMCNVVVLVVATVSYFLLQRKGVEAQEASVVGEWVTAFFMANSARSAGFNSVDVSLLTSPALIMVASLMWIGASPGSTGGGVKVTTVALALLNIVALARGKESVEIYKRRIAAESINKAFAIILLSFLTIAFCFVLLNFSDPDQPMKALLFETISAYTTCGLSLGITSSLSATSKLIIIFTMFVGRVGTLTLLVAFIKNTKNKSYIYPTEKILF